MFLLRRLLLFLFLSLPVTGFSLLENFKISLDLVRSTFTLLSSIWIPFHLFCCLLSKKFISFSAGKFPWNFSLRTSLSVLSLFSFWHSYWLNWTSNLIKFFCLIFYLFFLSSYFLGEILDLTLLSFYCFLFLNFSNTFNI